MLSFMFHDFFFLHIFFFCTKMPKVNSKKQSNETTKKQDEPLKKKRNFLTVVQKKEVYLKKIAFLFLKNKDLAKEYVVSEGMISDTLKVKNCWLAIDTESYQAGLKREKKISFLKIEEALTI